jgi:hypothetical protein
MGGPDVLTELVVEVHKTPHAHRYAARIAVNLTIYPLCIDATYPRAPFVVV